MAIIPTYEPDQVKRAPMPGVRWTEQADPNAFGANVAAANMQAGKALAAVGGELADTALKLKHQEDANRVLEASTQFDKATNELFYHQEKGIFASKGKNALGAAGEAGKAIDELTNKIAGELRDPRLQQKFAQVIANRRSALAETALRHEMKEREVWSKEATDSALTGALNNIKLSFSNDDLVKVNFQVGEAAIRKHAAEIGMSEDGVKVEIAKFRQAAHVAIINRYIAGEDGAGARAYFEKNRKEIPDQAAVEEAVNKLEMFGESQSVIKELIAKYGENEEAMVAELEKRYGGKPIKLDRFKRDLRGEVSHIRSLRERAEEDSFDAVIKNALAVKQAGGSVNAALKAVALGKLKGRHQISAEAQIKSIFGVDEEGLPKTTPRAVWTEVFYGIETGQVKNLRQLLIQYGDKISRSDYESFAKAVAHGGGDADGLSWSTVLSKIIKTNSIPDKDVPVLYAEIAEAFQAHKAKTGGPPSLADKEAIVNDLVKKTVTQKGFVIDSTERKYKTNFPVGANIRWDAKTNSNQYVDDDGELGEKGAAYTMSYDKTANKWYVTKGGKKYWVSSD